MRRSLPAVESTNVLVAARLGAVLVGAVLGGGVLGGAGSAFAAEPAAASSGAYVLADVQCDPAGDGVADLVLVNDSEASTVVFVVEGVDTEVAPLSAGAVSFTQLSDGDVDIPVQIDGVESRVHLTVRCDLPMVEVAPPPVPLRPGGTGGALALADARSLPATGSDGSLWGLAAAMTGAGAVLSLVARRRSRPLRD